MKGFDLLATFAAIGGAISIAAIIGHYACFAAIGSLCS